MSNGARILAALSDPARAKVFGWAVVNDSSDDRTMTRCAGDLGWTLAAVAKTVAKLEDLGLVIRDGEKLSPDLKLLHEAAEQLDNADPIVKALNDFATLAPYFAHGMLTGFPASPRGLTDLARFLSTLLEDGTSYSEAEVNNILGAVHPDFAALRRLIVDLDFVSRTPYGDYRRRAT
jgi:hypothetical protein